MATKIDLSAPPYFDNYNDKKNYGKLVFKPSVAVQTRELNELQTTLQRQIEKFGESIFKTGTIISGVNFVFHNNYAYAKLLDAQVDGTVVLPSRYVGNFVKNSANLVAYVLNSEDGFEAADPDLKTLYLNYINSGNDGITNAFSAGDTLTVYSSNVGIESIVINNGGLGFSNSDNLIITPAVAVNVSSGSFSNGDYIIQPSTGANLEIIEVDDLTLAQSNQVLLYIKPRDTDLANGLANSVMWTLNVNESVVDSSNAVTATIENIFGTNANGTIITNSSGKVTSIHMSVKGSGYTYLPAATIQSQNNASGITNLDLSPRNYIAKIQIATTTNSVGNGYAFSVGEGVIFQKGYFVNVQPQTIIVSKYSNSPNNISVGFDTREEIVDYNRDPSLLDNVLGTDNETAPGADRLKLTPVLVVANTDVASSNNEFFSIVEWSEGQPYKQNGSTVYSRIGDEMANRTYEQSGDFVTDRYYVTTAIDDNFDLNGQYYKVIIDPGQAYIRGYRVQTSRNFNINVTKGTDTKTANAFVSLNYGNYVRINQVGGLFQYSTGDVVDLYDQPKGFLSDSTLIGDANTNPVGTKIGEARIRSLVLENGIAGDKNTTYRLYLFNVRMNAGKKFDSVKSIYYDGAYKGIADTVLSLDPTTQTNIAKLEGTNNNRLLFKSSVESLKNSNNTYYVYRTIDQTVVTSNNGTLIKSIASNPNEFYTYTGALSDSQMKELYVVPLSRNLVAYANLTGDAATSDSSNALTGNGTTYISDLASGDWVQVYANSTANEIKQVMAVTNNTSVRLDSNVSFTAAAATIYRVFPRNVPVPFGSRSGLTANVDANSNILTLNFGMTFQGTTTANTALGVNIRRGPVSSTSKTANRKRFVKIAVANNEGGSFGPWCLGVPDVFRLRNVYIANTASVNTTSRNITNEFYADHNQTANYLDLSWIYKKERTPTVLGNDDYLLVEFDYFSASGPGYFDTVSYLNTANSEQISVLDSTPLANLTTSAASLEVPEVHTYDNKHYDLLNTIDFRPTVETSVAPTEDHTIAPVNPAVQLSFGNTADPSNDLKFPYPDSLMTTQIESYMGRIDHVNVEGGQGRIYVTKGQASDDPRKRYEPTVSKNSLVIYKINVPAYPNFVENPTRQFREIVNTNVINEISSYRPENRLITSLISDRQAELLQPKNYTMEDLGNMERRLQDVERYVALTLLETNLVNKVIPSSIDRSLNRFKFGFAVDDFSTDLYRDLNNPQYSATKETDESSPVETFRIAPPLFPWEVRCALPGGNLPYIDEPILGQNYATEEYNECIAQSGAFVNATGESFYYALQPNPYGNESRTDYLVMSNTAGLATLYFYNYTGYDQIDIYQANATANVLVASSNASANLVVSLTTSDKTFLSTNSVAQEFYTGGSGSISSFNNSVDLNQTFTRDGDAVNFAGKISFTHNPSAGRNYMIKVTKGNGSTLWRYLIRYPSDTEYNSSIIDPCNPIAIITNPDPEEPPPVTPPPSTVYTGSFYITTEGGNGSGEAWAQWKVIGSGFKPNTTMTMYVNGKKLDWGNGRAMPVKSDKNGKINQNIEHPNEWPGIGGDSGYNTVYTWSISQFKYVPVVTKGKTTGNGVKLELKGNNTYGARNYSASQWGQMANKWAYGY